jgi:hypothetical protein
MLMTRLRIPCVVALFAVLAGCNQTPATPEAAAPVEEAGIKRRAAEDLPAVGEYLPVLDDGRVEIAPPEGWIDRPRTSKFLAAFTKDKASEYPLIRVTADSSPVPVLGDLSEENADEFATVFDDKYKKKAASFPEPSRPIYLGDKLYLRQVRLVAIKDHRLVLQSLATIEKGRMYKVELFCEVDPSDPADYATPLTAARDYAYAVAAHLAVVEPAAATSEKPADEKTE